jgi:hypothetical protein
VKTRTLDTGPQHFTLTHNTVGSFLFYFILFFAAWLQGWGYSFSIPLENLSFGWVLAMIPGKSCARKHYSWCVQDASGSFSSPSSFAKGHTFIGSRDYGTNH